MTQRIKKLKFGLISLALLSIFVMSPSEDALATPAWTNSWTIIGNAASGGPTSPSAITADQQGNVYVINGGVISKLSFGSTVWQNLTQNGLISNPELITIDKNGTLYVTDATNKIRKLPSGAALWETIDNGGYWGAQGIAVDGNLTLYLSSNPSLDYGPTNNACLKLPQNGTWTVLRNSMRYIGDIESDEQGNLYITTQKSGAEGKNEILTYMYGGWGSVGGVLENAPQMPGRVAVDKSGNVYVLDGRTLKVWTDHWINLGGSTFGGPQWPNDVAVDGMGNIYLTDTYDGKVWKLQSPATQLVWQTQPANGTAGRVFANPPTVALKDAYGHVETGDSTHTVTLSLNNANGASISNYTVKLQNGIATFNNLTVNKVGSGYTLTPSCNLAAGLAAPGSGSFNMTAPPAPVVTGISPASGLGGIPVTVSGYNLTAASVVEFGTVAGVNVIVNSDTSVTVTAPVQGAGTVDVCVTTPGGKSAVVAADKFTYNQPGSWTSAWTTIGDNSVFSYATGIATGSNGYIYVVDQNGNKLQRLDSNSWYNISPGTTSGPIDVYVDSRTNINSPDIYIADYIAKKIFKNGSVFVDFTSTAWSSLNPMALDMDKNGNIYVAGNNIILKWSSGIWSEITYGGGFSAAQGIAVNGNGDVYVSDSINNFVKVLIHNTNVWSSPIGTGLSSPGGIAVDVLGNVYVADYNNGAIKEMRLGATEWRALGGLRYPRGVSLDSLGNLYVTASDLAARSLVLKKDAPATKLVWQTQPSNGNTGKDLTPYPTMVLKDANGNIVTSDNTDTVTLSLYSSNGATLAGTTTVTMVNGIAHFVDINISKAGQGYYLVPSCSMQDISISNSGFFDITDSSVLPQPIVWSGTWTSIGDYFDGISTSAANIAVSNDLAVYVTCRNTNILMKRYNGSWYNVTPGALNYPNGVAVDNSGAVYIADTENMRVVEDGAVIGSFNFRPFGVAVNGNGSVVYVGGETGSGTPYIMKYSNNVWSSCIYHGVFSRPDSLVLDSFGNLYVADKVLNVVRKLPAGTYQWKTIGTGFNSPSGIAVDSSGNVYVADSGGAIKVLIVGSSQWATIPASGTYGARDVAVDRLGNLYAVYNGNVYQHQAPATQLVWQTQPGGGTGGTPWNQQPVLCLKDANDNIITNDNSSKVAISLISADGATLQGTTEVTLQNGVATFSGLKVDKLGTYKLAASCANINSVASNAFDVTLGTPAKLVWQVQPGGGNSGQTWERQPSIYVVDAGGNLVTGDSGSTVTVALSDAGDAVLKGTAQATFQNGVATFSDLKMEKAGTYTLTANREGVTGSASASFTITPGTATQLVWQTQPGGGTGGTTWLQQPRLALQDAYANAVTSDSSSKVNITLAEANGATLAGTMQITLQNGVAAFTDLKINKIGSYTLTASCENITSQVSTSFDITLGDPVQLGWHTQPNGSTSGSVLSAQPVLYLEDVGGNVITSDSSTTVTIELINPNDASLAGTTQVTLQNGIATFTDLKVVKAGSYTLKATCGSIISLESSSFTITPGTASQLVWQTQPGGGTGGTAWLQQPQLALQDANGNIMTNDSSSQVTIALTEAQGADLEGTAQITLQNGIAVFTGLIVDKIGSYTLTASCGNITSQTSSPFDIILGDAAQLIWQVQPNGAASGSGLSTQPVLYLADAGGNITSGDSSSAVTVKLTSANGASLDGTVQVTLQNGIGIFTDLKVEKAGSYTLTATCGSITSEVSSSFSITPGSAAKLVWQTQPGGGTGGVTWVTQPELALQDAYGNVVVNDNTTLVTIALKNPDGATLNGTAQLTLQSGKARFSGLNIDKIGSGYILELSSSLQGIAVPESNPFDIILGPAAQLTWHTQPGGSASGSNLNTQPVLYLKDAGGNIKTDDSSSNVTILLTSPDGAALAGTKTIAVQAGVAAFTDLKVEKAGSFTLTANCGSITSTASESFSINPGPAAQLIWKVQPGNANSGADLNPQPQVALGDAYGNVVDDSNSNVTIAISGSETVPLVGTATINLHNGFAAYQGLKIEKAGSYTLTAICGSIVSPNSSTFTIKSGTVYTGNSTIVAGKSSVNADGSDSTTITVTLKDTYGNPAGNSVVTLDQGSGSSVIKALYGETDANGIEVFTVNSTKAEKIIYTANVNDIPVTGNVEVSFTPGAVEKLNINALGTQTAGVPFNVAVTAQDHYGNTATGYSGTIALASTDARAELPADHTFEASNSGVYTFSGITLKTPGIQTITASDTGSPISITSGNITVNTGAPSLEESTLAAGKASLTADGTDYTTLTVTLRDVCGNPVKDSTVNLNQAAGSSVITPAASTTDADGIATFTVKSQKAEEVTYTARVNNAAVTPALTVEFTPGPATQLIWITQPGGGADGQIWPQQPVLVLKDGFDNVKTDDSSSTVTLTITNANGAILGGTVQVTLQKGMATFTDLNVDQVGTYTLEPVSSLSGITCINSNSFGISLLPSPTINFNDSPVTGPIIAISSASVSVSGIIGGTAYYSLDGTAPTLSSTPYSGPFTIDRNRSVAVAVYDAVNGQWSSPTIASFTIQVAMPTADLVDGSVVRNNTTLNLAVNTPGATIHYTTDDSAPAASSPSGNAVIISGASGATVTVKTYGEKAGCQDSDVAVYIYRIRSSHSNSDSATPKPPEPPAVIGAGGTTSFTAPLTMNNSTATASTQINTASLDLAFQQADVNQDNLITVTVEIPSVAGARAYETTLPVSYLSGEDQFRAIEVKTSIASVTVNSNMLSSSDTVGAQNISLTIAAGDKSKLPANIQEQIGDRPVVELALKVNDRILAWSNDNAPVTISIPYTPNQDEMKDPEHITVWYIDGSGKAIAVPSGRYNSSTGKVTFNTTHFSKYTVAFVQKTFADLNTAEWARRPIEILASKGIVRGISEQDYSPQSNSTRADFLYSLVRTLDVDAAIDGNFADINPDAYYFREIAIAKKLGITNGTGDGKFSPDSNITRQDMIVLTERALRMFKGLENRGTASDLDKYSDKPLIAAYAIDSISSVVKEGLIIGSEDKLNPLGNTTRAEEAVFLYRIYNKY